jgi:hypothetical protein
MTYISIILSFFLLQTAGIPSAGEPAVQSTAQRSGTIRYVENKRVKIETRDKVAIYFLDGMEGTFTRNYSVTTKTYYDLRVETSRQNQASLLLVSEKNNVYYFDVKPTIRIHPEGVSIKKSDKLQPVVVMPRDTIFLSDRKHTILELPYKIQNGQYLDSVDTRLVINDITPSKSGKKSFLAFGSSGLYGAEKEQTLFIEDVKRNKHFYNVKYVNDSSRAMSYYKVAEEMITAAQPQKPKSVVRTTPKTDLRSYLYDDIFRIGIILGLLTGILFGSVFLLLKRIRKLESLAGDLAKTLEDERENNASGMRKLSNDVYAISLEMGKLKNGIDKRHNELENDYERFKQQTGPKISAIRKTLQSIRTENRRLSERVRLSSVARNIVRRYNAPYGKPRRTIVKPKTGKNETL